MTFNFFSRISLPKPQRMNSLTQQIFSGICYVSGTDLAAAELNKTDKCLWSYGAYIQYGEINSK